MASEILAVPEDHLAEVIEVIRAGLKSGVKVSGEVQMQLTRWCDKEAAYLAGEEYEDEEDDDSCCV